MADFFNHIFIFLFGLAVGSFLNCVIYRLETGGTFLRGRSFCPHCKHLLVLRDLIPVFSFLFLKGKCRYCRKPISLQYPLVELATAIIFLLIFWQFISTLFPFITILYFFIIASFLIVIFVYDLKHYIILDRVIYPAVVIAFLYNIYQFTIHHQQSTINNFLSAFGAAIFFLIIVLVSREKWLGVGDVKLAFLMGLFLGWPNILLALFLAFFVGAVVGTGLIIFDKKTLKSEIPFGPFLVTGTFLALFWGNELIGWYQGLFLVK